MLRSEICRCFPVLLLLSLLAITPMARAQQGKPLLQIQRLHAELETDSNASSIGRNIYDSSSKGEQQMDVSHYPNSSTCLLVYDDGRFFLEKRDEHTLSKPKAKSAEGTLSPDDLQHLKSILDEEDLKKVATPVMPDLPTDAQAIKEAERLDVEIARAGGPQQFTFMKERVKTGATRKVSSSASLSGVDTYIDDGLAYKKTLNPLVKFFDEVAKKNKVKESKPQYCQSSF